MTTKENVIKILDETKKVAEDNDEVTHVFVLLRVGN